MSPASTSTLKSAGPSTTDKAAEAEAASQAAFLAEDRRERLRVGKLGCSLVIILMPLGVTLDYFVYPGEALTFLGVRLLCSLLTGGLLALHLTAWGQQKIRWLGPPIALFPAICIATMIALEDGWTSPYYAGLNLVLIAVNVVARWTLRESLAIVASVIAIYLVAGFASAGLPDQAARPALFNNLYFLSLTGVIVVAGNALYNQLRRREFAVRFEDESGLFVVGRFIAKEIEPPSARRRSASSAEHAELDLIEHAMVATATGAQRDMAAKLAANGEAG